MGRSPSRSSDGVDAAQLNRVEPRLLKAIEDKRDDDAIAIIEQAKAYAQEAVNGLRFRFCLLDDCHRNHRAGKSEIATR